MLYTILEIIAVVCGVFGAYYTASFRKYERFLGFAVFTVGAICAVPLYYHKGLYGIMSLTFIYILLDFRGLKNNYENTYIRLGDKWSLTNFRQNLVRWYSKSGNRRG